MGQFSIAGVGQFSTAGNNIEDVQSVRPDLTDEQASLVLRHLEKNHDATIGINWDTIEAVADYLFPESLSEREGA